MTPRVRVMSRRESITPTGAADARECSVYVAVMQIWPSLMSRRWNSSLLRHCYGRRVDLRQSADINVNKVDVSHQRGEVLFIAAAVNRHKKTNKPAVRRWRADLH